jgi:hypothetical protein
MESKTIIQISIEPGELQQMIEQAVSRAIQRPGEHRPPGKPFIKGIHELAKFLNVSPARAQKLKNEGAFPFWQDGRTLLFDPEKVRAAMMM